MLALLTLIDHRHQIDLGLFVDNNASYKLAWHLVAGRGQCAGGGLSRAA